MLKQAPRSRIAGRGKPPRQTLGPGELGLSSKKPRSFQPGLFFMDQGFFGGWPVGASGIRLHGGPALAAFGEGKKGRGFALSKGNSCISYPQITHFLIADFAVLTGDAAGLPIW